MVEDPLGLPAAAAAAAPPDIAADHAGAAPVGNEDGDQVFLG